ncbi:MAG: DUF924 family protein [Brevundimonas sp.]|uniref:DUF924 family protein n=1 Tax=Brevundimonas sp. TaxID=1871086 RepID=UPI00391893D7
MSTDITPSAVVAFWKEAGPKMWFAKDDAFDADFRRRFHDAHVAAARRELDDWAGTAEGSLALLILLDQFPRNSFRGTGHAFATDPLARMFAVRALEAGHDLKTDGDIRRFFYLPLQHSEDPADQDRQVELFQTRMAREPDDRWAEHHHGVIARFGRFPHRNRALGRETTAEEQAFLGEDGFRG